MSAIKKLPDLDDTKAMVIRGRISSLMSARSDAVSELRDVAVTAQRLELGELSGVADRLREIADRFVELSLLSEQVARP